MSTVRSRTTDQTVSSASRRTFLAGAALALGGIGLASGSARAAPGELTDLGYGAGALYRGQTAVVQRVRYAPTESKSISQVTVTSPVPATAWDAMTLKLSDEGTARTGSVGDLVGGGTYTVFDLGFRPVSEPVEMALSVTVSASAAATTSTGFKLRVYHGRDNDFVLDRVSDGSNESLTGTYAPTGKARRPSYRRPRFSLVSDRPSFYEGMNGYERVTVTPEAPKVGEPITVTAEVSNVGNATGTYVGRLTNWFSILGTESVTLVPGETATLTYEFTLDKAGTHRLFLTDDHIGDVVVSR